MRHLVRAGIPMVAPWLLHSDSGPKKGARPFKAVRRSSSIVRISSSGRVGTPPPTSSQKKKKAQAGRPSPIFTLLDHYITLGGVNVTFSGFICRMKTMAYQKRSCSEADKFWPRLLNRQLLDGVILSAAVFQAERRGCLTESRRDPRPHRKRSAIGLGITVANRCRHSFQNWSSGVNECNGDISPSNGICGTMTGVRLSFRIRPMSFLQYCTTRRRRSRP